MPHVRFAAVVLTPYDRLRLFPGDGRRVPSARGLRAVTMLAVAMALSLLTSASGAAVERAWVIAYVAGVSDNNTCLPKGCEWRVYRPETDEDLLLTALADLPHAAVWDDSFERVEYRAGRRLYRMRWAPQARPEVLGVLPDTWNPAVVDAGPWMDRTSGAWRILLGEGRGVDYRLRVLELSGAGQWRTVAERGPSCAPLDEECWAPVRRAEDPRVVNAAATLLDGMRIEAHTGFDPNTASGENVEEGISIQVPSQTVPNRALQMRAALGDSWHAMAPLAWVDVESGRTNVIPSAGGACDEPQLAFEERGPFLLVVGEFTGRCPVVVDMRSGAVRRLFPGASLGVWVRAPAR